ncbi:MAG: response regulator [Pseudomonadota bacterium]
MHFVKPNQDYNILILDDEPIVCKRLKAELERSGYRVEAFTNSMQALGRIEEKGFDVIITDLKMKEIDGEQVLRIVKDKYPTTQVIIITGYATSECAKQCLSNGAFDFISKPFKLDDIQLVVNRAIYFREGVFGGTPLTY